MRNAQEGDVNAQWQRRCGYTLRFIRERLSAIQRDFPLEVEKYAPDKLKEMYQLTLAEPQVMGSYQTLAQKLEDCLGKAVKLGEAFYKKNEKNIKRYLSDLRTVLFLIFSEPYLDQVCDALDDFQSQSTCCFGIFAIQRDKHDVSCVAKLADELKKQNCSGNPDVLLIQNIIADFDRKTGSNETVFRNILTQKKLLKKARFVSEKQSLTLPLIEFEL